MNKLWYALQRDSEDDWGTGTFDKDEAIKKWWIVKDIIHK